MNDIMYVAIQLNVLGGLLVDFGVLQLKHSTVSSYFIPSQDIPKLPPSHPAIIEWRAMTVIEL